MSVTSAAFGAGAAGMNAPGSTKRAVMMPLNGAVSRLLRFVRH